MIITYIILAVLIEFVLCKLFWSNLKDQIDYDEFWLNYTEGWIIAFGGILFPLLIIIILLVIFFSWLSDLWDKHDITEKITGNRKEDYN